MRESAGYTVVDACNGRDSMQQYQSVLPDWIIPHLLMLEQEGLETIRQLRRDNPTVMSC